MTETLSISEFINLYSNELQNKEEIIKQLNISEYIYKKVIKEYNLKRKHTSKFNRIVSKNSNIEVVKIQEEPKKEEVEVVFIDDTKQILKEDLKKQIRDKLQKSKSLREN